jgi:hypothetical protein
MKGRSLLGLIVSLTVFGAGSLAVLAQSQRYPTNAEIQRLVKDFPRVIQSNQDFLSSKPTASEIQRLRSFVAAWSRVDSTIAPFLGQWNISDATLAIYPSNVRGRVCMIIAGDWNDEHGSVLTGTVSNNQIRVSNRQVIVRQGDYLGILRVENNKPIIFPLGSPKPLESPTKFLESQGMQQFNPVITQQFNAAGCSASRPKRR